MNENRNIAFTWFLSAWSLLMAFITPIKGILVLIFFAVLIDLLFGFSASVKKNKVNGVWKILCHFQSGKLKKSIVKVFFYLIFTMFIFMMEFVLLGDSLYITKLGTAMVVLTELKSICESMDIITGKDVFTTLFRKIKNVFVNKISEKISDNEK